MALDPAVAEDLAKLALELSQNPETRRDFGKLVKKAKPQSHHAQAFKDVDLEDKFDSFRAEQQEREVKAQQQAVLDRMNAQRRKLIDGTEDGSKYDEDTVKKIEALMEKKGITDYEDGRVLFMATQPPSHPKPEDDAPKHGATWEFPEWGTFGKDPVGASRNSAYAVIDEFRRKRA